MKRRKEEGKNRKKREVILLFQTPPFSSLVPEDGVYIVSYIWVAHYSYP
jgi:hypothetical protein